MVVSKLREDFCPLGEGFIQVYAGTVTYLQSGRAHRKSNDCDKYN